MVSVYNSSIGIVYSTVICNVNTAYWHEATIRSYMWPSEIWSRWSMIHNFLQSARHHKIWH